MTNSESFAAVGTIEWTSAEDAAKLIGVNASLLSIDKFEAAYDEVWTRTHAETGGQSPLDSSGGPRVCSTISLLYLFCIYLLLKK